MTLRCPTCLDQREIVHPKDGWEVPCPTCRKWLDGKKVWDWVLERKPCDWAPHNELPESQMRRVREWRRGSKASASAADEILTRLGLCLSHLPDDFYVKAPLSGGQWRPITDKQRMKAATLLARGYRVVDVAREVGISDRSVRKIRDRVGA